MGELWRDLVEMLRRKPSLWVPVLVADVLGYLANLGRNGLLRAFILHRTAQQSVLGGQVVHGPVTASVIESTTIFALLLSWFTYFLRILLYTGAFFATAALVRAVADRVRNPSAEVGPSLGRNWGGIFELALRSLTVYAVAALLFSWASPYLSKHGHTELLHNAWFAYFLSVLVPLALAFLLPPVALRILTGRAPDPATRSISQQFAAMLVIVISLLSNAVNSNSRQSGQVAAGARYPLEIVGSLLSALPFVLLFTGIALLARRVAVD